MADADYDRFYRALFGPLQERLGPLAPETIVALIGFDAGGPLNLCTIDASASVSATYVSCELAVRDDQVPASCGKYEVLMTTDDERLARSLLTSVGRMSLEVQLGHRHTMDLGAVVDESSPIQGCFFEQLYSTKIEGRSYGVLRVVGVTRGELDYVLEEGLDALIDVLVAHDVYPETRERDPLVSERRAARGRAPKGSSRRGPPSPRSVVPRS